ncbi:MAG: FKBP-type peptidyl-prolyl cis-trans isomerase [Telluria sp.]
MTSKLPLIAATLAFAIATLTACGGSNPDAPVYSPAALTKTEVVVGTGATAVAGKKVKVHYTGYLYNTTVTSFKGAQFDTSVGSAPYTYFVGSVNTIVGFDQGVTGMKVGGKRSVFIPASLGYGAAGSGGKVPPNSGLVFDLELLEVI